MSSRVDEAVRRVLEAREGGSSKGKGRGRSRRSVALPRELTSSEARDLEQRLAREGLRGVRYRSDPSDMSVLDIVETAMGLDEDEPRVEWEE